MGTEPPLESPSLAGAMVPPKSEAVVFAEQPSNAATLTSMRRPATATLGRETMLRDDKMGHRLGS
jgi:hypothetical protein